MQVRRIALSTLILVTVLGFGFPTLRGHLHAAQQEVPVSFICPMDAEVLDDKPGNCPICKMELLPVRIESGWSCPIHAAVLRDKPGTCPLDRRELVQVTLNHYWDCDEKPVRFYADPGKCANGRPREEKRVVRAHGDHNPRHGGQFFMAEDKWHHLEGTYPANGLFRLFLYDNFTKPLEVKGITGRAVTEEQNGKELAAFELKPSRDGKTLEAQIKGATVPLRVAAKVKFTKATSEQRFDFSFPELSKEPISAPVPVTTTSGGTSAPTPRPAPSAATDSAALTPVPAPAAVAPVKPASPPGVALPIPDSPPAATPVLGAAPTLTDCSATMSRTDAAQLADVLPSSSGELLKLISMCSSEVSKLIADGQFGYVYQPTMVSKDIALALEGHVNELPDQRKAQAATAIRRVVLAAWQLDMYGDLGNKDKLTDTYNLFAAAVADIKTAYGASK